MAALSDLSDIANRVTGGNSGTPQLVNHFIDNRIGAAAATTTTAGRISSLWRYNRTVGGEGAKPTTAAVPTNTSPGSWFHNDASGGRELWMLGVEAMCTQAGSLIIYDRLLHCGSLSGTVTTAQTVGGTLTRNTDGIGNQIWVEIYTLIGTTATTITASYTNQDGTSGRTTKAASIGGTGLREAERIIPLALQDGDTGVQAVASVTLTATTGTAGEFGVTIAHPYSSLYFTGQSQGAMRDNIAGLPSIQAIAAGACMTSAFLANSSTTAPQLYFAASLIEK